MTTSIEAVPVNAIDLCPPKHLEAADIGPLASAKVLTIEKVHYSEVGKNKEIKGAVKFKEFTRSMVLNRTNLKRLIAHFGQNLTEWPGKQVEVYASEAEYEGEVRPCLRVREKK